MGAKEAAKQTAALERGSGPAAAAVGDTRLWECAQMFPAPGNAPSSGAGSSGGRGDARGEPGLRGAVDPSHVPSLGWGLPTCAFTHRTQHPRIVTRQLHPGPEGPWPGWDTEQGPRGCSPGFRAAPGIPIPVPTQVRGEEGGKKRERVTVPRVPHPRVELSGALFPSKPRSADLSPRCWQHWGGFGCSRAVPGGSGHGGFGAVEP